MALKDLTAKSMLALSEAWLGSQRPLLEDMPMVWAMLPALEKAHAALEEAQQHETEALMELGKIEDEASRIDHRHDRKARGLFDALSAFALISDESGEAATYLNLRDRMFPEGKSITLQSYAVEVQEAEHMVERITDDDLELLGSLPVPGGHDLRHVFDDWLSTARELGQLEARRAELASGQDVDAVEEVIDARNAWIRATRGLVTMLELEEADDEVKSAILSPLREAETEAETS